MKEICKEMKKLAAEIMTADDEKGYIYDPDHKQHPKGGGWQKTEKGWSKAKPGVPAQQKDPEPGGDAFKKKEQKDLENRNKPAVVQEQKPVSSKFRDKPEVKAMRKKISVNPDRVVAELMGKTGKIKDEYKPMLIGLYKEWLRDNKDTQDPDGVSKTDKVKLALKVLQKPKFPKTAPKITGNMRYLVKDNGLKKDEVFELAGFKEAIKDHPRMSDKEYKKRITQGIRLPRNEQQLKQAFIQHMNPQNYDSMDAFQAAKARVQKMSPGDFGKLLGALNNDEEEVV